MKPEAIGIRLSWIDSNGGSEGGSVGAGVKVGGGSVGGGAVVGVSVGGGSSVGDEVAVGVSVWANSTGVLLGARAAVAVGGGSVGTGVGDGVAVGSAGTMVGRGGSA